MRLIIAIALLCQQCIAGIGMLTFDQPGNYILSPADYGYADEIIVEMWGAGGGGCSGNCGIGGGSGGYVKAKVITNSETFNLTVGQGGAGGIDYHGMVSSCCMSATKPWLSGDRRFNGNNGTITTFSNMITITGGNGGNYTITTTVGHYGNIVYGESPISTTNWINSTRVNVIRSYNGLLGQKGVNTDSYDYCYYTPYSYRPYLMKAGDGAGYGGIGNNITFCRTSMDGYPPTVNSTNGNTPAGGGGGSFNLCTQCQGQINGCTRDYCPTTNPVIPFYYPKAGDGGNGTIIIYYSSPITQSVSASPTMSVSNTFTITSTSSMTASCTPTIPTNNTSTTTSTSSTTASTSDGQSETVSETSIDMMDIVIATIIMLITITMMSLLCLIVYASMCCRPMYALIPRARSVIQSRSIMD